MIQSMDCPLQIRRIAEIEVIALFLQELTRLLGFFVSLLAQIDIGPSGEEVFLIPFALAMPYEYQFHIVSF